MGRSIGDQWHGGARARVWGPLLTGMLAATVVCGGGPGKAGPLPVTPGVMQADDPLEDAIEHYRQTGDAAQLQRAIAVDPDDDRAAVWRELLALSAYEGAWALGEQDDPSPDAHDPAPLVDTRDLKTVVRDYPDTFAAQMARAGLDTQSHVLESAAQRVLSTPALNAHAVRFLAGDDSWSVAVDNGDEEGIQIDLRRFRQRNEAPVRASVRAALLADKCQGAVGYCRWFVERYPDDEAAATLRQAMKTVWYARAHPPWQGKAHLQCAYNCSNTCRTQPVEVPAVLTDGCYDACYDRC